MKKKYALSIIMILFGIVSLIGFIFPFYRVDIQTTLGNTNVNGSISITGLSFILGQTSVNTGYFLDLIFNVKPQIIYMVIAAIILIVILLSFISLFIKRKDSALFFFLNIFIFLVGISLFSVTVTSLEIANISIRNDQTLKDFLLSDTAIQSEGLAFGAFITSFFIMLTSIASLFLALLSLYDYRMSLRPVSENKEDYTELPDYGEKKLDYHEVKGIEHKESRFLTFKKKDNKEETNVDKTQSETKKDDSPKLSVYEREGINESKNNKYGIKTKTGAFDTDYKEEIETKKVSNTEKSAEEKIKDLDKLLEEHMISKEDYEKYKEAILKKYDKED